MAYHHLRYEQRCKIEAFMKVGFQQNDIAEEMGVSASTISREIKRNTLWTGLYSPSQAHGFYHLRRRQSRHPKKFTASVEKMVKEKVLLDWSPEQISGYGKRHQLFSISHERIYQYLLKDKQEGGILYQHLRHSHKKYRKRYGTPKRNCTIKNRVTIDERPSIVDRKKRLGDWEIDTIYR